MQQYDPHMNRDHNNYKWRARKSKWHGEYKRLLAKYKLNELMFVYVKV